MNFLVKTLILLLLYAQSPEVSAHGGGDITAVDGGVIMGSAHFHLPIEIEFNGEIHYGYALPGGEAHGESGHGEADHHEGADEHGSGSHSGWAFAPSLQIGGDKIERYICLDRARSGDHHQRLRPILTASTSCSQYRYIRQGVFNLGLSAGFERILIPSAVGVITLGIAGAIEKSKTLERTVPHTNLPWRQLKLTMPKKASQLNKWSIGDKINFSGSGFLAVFANFGIGPLFHLGPSAYMEGSWEVLATKTGPTQLQVTVSKQKLVGVSLEADGIVAVVGLAAFRTRRLSYTFSFDFQSPRAFEAYQRLIKGDLRPAQLVSDSEEGVVAMNTQRILRKGSQAFVQVGFPYLFGATGIKGKVTTLSTTEDHQQESTEDIYAAVYARQSQSYGVLSHHRNHLLNFYSAVVKGDMERSHGEIDRDRDHDHHDKEINYAGTFKLFFNKDHASGRQLNLKLKKWRKVTGIDLFPSEFAQERFGYTRMEANFELSQKAITLLLKTVTQGRYISALHKLYLQRGNPSKKWKKYRRVLLRSRKYLERMEQAKAQADWKDFAKNLSLWGGSVFQHPLLIGLFVTLLPDTHKEFTVMGEKLPEIRYEF